MRFRNASKRRRSQSTTLRLEEGNEIVNGSYRCSMFRLASAFENGMIDPSPAQTLLKQILTQPRLVNGGNECAPRDDAAIARCHAVECVAIAEDSHLD